MTAMTMKAARQEVLLMIQVKKGAQRAPAIPLSEKIRPVRKPIRS